jgi:hypothetical protein
MKSLIVFLFLISCTLASTAQLLRTNDAVEVDILLGDTSRYHWKKATVTGYDTLRKVYNVKILDGDKMDIPSHSPEKWIRPVVDRNLVIEFGPAAKIPFQDRESLVQEIECKPTEKFVRKNLRTLMAREYKDFEYIFVDITKVKPQHGEDDPKYEGQFIYPYKIEMLIHLKRTVLMGGKLYTEYQTWEYDREYAYATRGKRKCEFYPLQFAPPKLISRGWF